MVRPIEISSRVCRLYPFRDVHSGKIYCLFIFETGQAQ